MKISAAVIADAQRFLACAGRAPIMRWPKDEWIDRVK